jgi:excisionase family DNA binding protein
MNGNRQDGRRDLESGLQGPSASSKAIPHARRREDGQAPVGSVPPQKEREAAKPTGGHDVPGEIVDVKTAARFLGVSRSLVYAYVERKQIPHFRMMGRSIRFRLSELAEWRQQFHVMEESK